MKFLKYIILILIAFNIFLASRWILDGNLFFHTDIARDFLLMEDIADNRHLTLIGPRSGAIPGLFHGPLWLYINLPAFIIGGGNPVYVGWFWVVLYISSLLVIYLVTRRIFGKEEGILSALLLSAVTILQVRALFNPYGALVLSPLFFYFLIKYLQNKDIKTLVLSLFVLGLIIQFQMAFGVPILILVFFYLLYYLIRSGKLRHISAFLILLVPLSTHILFEIRNKFLQIKSVSDYLWGSQNHGKLKLDFIQFAFLRAKEFVVDGFGVLSQNNNYLSVLLLVLVVYAVIKVYKSQDKNLKRITFLLLYFYVGFWFFTIFFRGPVWGYYYMPFIPLLIILFVSVRKIIPKAVFYLIFGLIYLLNFSTGFKDMISYSSNAATQDVSTWKFNQLVAQKVFSGSESEFGYFIFTPDLYGYSPRYALDLYQKNNRQKTVKPYKKEAVTFLVIAPPPEYGKDPNSVWYQKNTNSSAWKNNDIKIFRKADNVTRFDNGFSIEKYNLTSEEVTIEVNPFLINGIFFR